VRVDRLHQHVVRRAGVHDVDDAVNDLVGLDAEQRRADDLPRLLVSSSTRISMKPSVSARSRARPTRDIARRPTSVRRPVARASLAESPQRASGGST
jgi:hypothetical protein